MNTLGSHLKQALRSVTLKHHYILLGVEGSETAPGYGVPCDAIKLIRGSGISDTSHEDSNTDEISKQIDENAENWLRTFPSEHFFSPSDLRHSAVRSLERNCGRRATCRTEPVDRECKSWEHHDAFRLPVIRIVLRRFRETMRGEDVTNVVESISHQIKLECHCSTANLQSSQVRQHRFVLDLLFSNPRTKHLCGSCTSVDPLETERSDR